MSEDVSLLNLHTGKIMMNLFFMPPPSLSLYSRREEYWSKKVDQFQCGWVISHLFSPLKTRCLTNGISGTQRCVMWAKRNPLGQLHSNNVAFQLICTAPTGQFSGHPLPPSAGPQYYSTTLAGELRSQPSLSEERHTVAVHDQLPCLQQWEWYTPNEMWIQCQQHCCETSIRTYSRCSFPLIRYTLWQKEERLSHLQKVATGLVI